MGCGTQKIEGSVLSIANEEKSSLKEGVGK